MTRNKNESLLQQVFYDAKAALTLSKMVHVPDFVVVV